MSRNETSHKFKSGFISFIANFNCLNDCFAILLRQKWRSIELYITQLNSTRR